MKWCTAEFTNWQECSSNTSSRYILIKGLLGSECFTKTKAVKPLLSISPPDPHWTVHTVSRLSTHELFRLLSSAFSAFGGGASCRVSWFGFPSQVSQPFHRVFHWFQKCLVSTEHYSVRHPLRRPNVRVQLTSATSRKSRIIGAFQTGLTKTVLYPLSFTSRPWFFSLLHSSSIYNFLYSSSDIKHRVLSGHYFCTRCLIALWVAFLLNWRRLCYFATSLLGRLSV